MLIIAPNPPTTTTTQTHTHTPSFSLIRPRCCPRPIDLPSTSVGLPSRTRSKDYGPWHRPRTLLITGRARGLLLWLSMVRSTAFCMQGRPTRGRLQRRAEDRELLRLLTMLLVNCLCSMLLFSHER